MQKPMIVIVAFTVLVFISYSEAFADYDFQKCYQSTNHHCLKYLPENNTAPMESTSSNWHVEIHLPQNGAQTIDGVFSSDNFTSLKSNPAVMAVVNIYTTTASPSLNYCPNAKYILENQGTPQYLDRFYNVSKGVDLTGYVYPSYCYIESGANPINGQGIPAVPEFGYTVAVVAAIAVLSAIVFTTRRDMRK